MNINLKKYQTLDIFGSLDFGGEGKGGFWRMRNGEIFYIWVN